MLIVNHLSCYMFAFGHTTKSHSNKRFLQHYVWIKLRTWLSKWIHQHLRKCYQNLFAYWTMEWEAHKLQYRYFLRIRYTLYI